MKYDKNDIVKLRSTKLGNIYDNYLILTTKEGAEPADLPIMGMDYRIQNKKTDKVIQVFEADIYKV